MKKYLIWSFEHNRLYDSSRGSRALYKSICKNSNYNPGQPDEEMRLASDYVGELMSDDWKAYLDAKKKLTDDDIRKMWMDAGGTFHGPITETATMTEERIIKFIRRLL